MKDVKPVLALPEGFQFVGFEKRDDVLTVTLVSTQVSPCCPLCRSVARRVHSCYTRHIADLPCAGQAIGLLIQVRKYFCEENTCPRKIFAERLVPFIDPFARVTKRLCQIVQIIGLATGGRLGVRVTDRLGIQTSRHTILRRIMALPTDPVGQVPQMGIDDFSFRRGRKFGTIIVDLRTHKVLDVPPDRTKDSSAAWIAAHPEIELVSRDRGGDYASAAATGAPQVVQCADRFPILKNLGEAVEGCVARHLAVKRTTQSQGHLEDHQPLEQAPRAARRSLKVERLQHAYREERLARYEQVIALRTLGMSQAAIAERVGISSSTASRWLEASAYPETTRGPYVSRIDPYLPYLSQRWEAGCHTMVRLHQELVARGGKRVVCECAGSPDSPASRRQEERMQRGQALPSSSASAAGDVSFPAAARRLGQRGTRDHTPGAPKPLRTGSGVYSRSRVCQDAAKAACSTPGKEEHWSTCIQMPI